LSDVETLLSKKAKPLGGAYLLSFSKLGPQDRMPWGIRLWLDDKMRVSAFEMPQKLSEVMGNDFILAAIEAIGRAQVSVSQRKVYMKLRSEVLGEQVLRLMGEPYRLIKKSDTNLGATPKGDVNQTPRHLGQNKVRYRGRRRLKVVKKKVPVEPHYHYRFGSKSSLFDVKIFGLERVKKVVMETNGYGLEVQVDGLELDETP
jgi:hypothetical protein